MRSKLAWLIPVFLLFALPATPADVVDAGARSEILVRPKIEDWRCRTGDDLRWAQPGWDDHDWTPCSPDSRLPLGISWRRLHVRLPETAATTPWSIGTLLPPASVLYANGQEIASSGHVGAKPRYTMSTYRIVSLPTLAHPGSAEVVLATRMQHSALTRTPLRLVIGDWAFDLELGNAWLLQQRQQLFTFYRLNTALPGNIVGLLALVLGAYALRLWSAQRSHYEYLWFAAIAAFLNFRGIISLITIGVPIDPHWFQAVNNGFAADPLLIPFFWTFLHRRIPQALALYSASILAFRLLAAKSH